MHVVGAVLVSKSSSTTTSSSDRELAEETSSGCSAGGRGSVRVVLFKEVSSGVREI